MLVIDEICEDQQKEFEEYEEKICKLESRLADKERYCYSSEKEVEKLKQEVRALRKEKKHLEAQLEESDQKLKHNQSVRESERKIVDRMFSSMANKLEANITQRIVQLEEKLEHAESASRIVKGEFSLSLHDRKQQYSLDYDQDESKISITRMTTPYFKKSSAELSPRSASQHFSTENCTKFDLSVENDSESDTELTPEQ
jgi:predicted RNase H-like nuclease (RuvC/YqgF family)